MYLFTHWHTLTHTDTHWHTRTHWHTHTHTYIYIHIIHTHLHIYPSKCWTSSIRITSFVTPCGWKRCKGTINEDQSLQLLRLVLWRLSGPRRARWNHHWLSIWARVKRRYERLQLRSVITTQNMWFTVGSDRGPYVAIPLFRLCLWLKLPVGRMTFRSFDVRVRHWSSRSGLVFLGSCKMACRQVYMR